MKLSRLSKPSFKYGYVVAGFCCCCFTVGDGNSGGGSGTDGGGSGDAEKSL